MGSHRILRLRCLTLLNVVCTMTITITLSNCYIAYLCYVYLASNFATLHEPITTMKKNKKGMTCMTMAVSDLLPVNVNVVCIDVTTVIVDVVDVEVIAVLTRQQISEIAGLVVTAFFVVY